MDQARTIRRYGLYGESLAPISADFAHVETIAARCSRYDWTIGAHLHTDISQVLLLGAGAGQMTADGTRHALDAPALVRVPAGVVHAFGFAPGARGWVLSIADALLADRRLAALVPADAFAGLAAVRVGDAVADRLDWLLADMVQHRAETAAVAAIGFARLAMILTLVAEAFAAAPGAAAGPGGHDRLALRFRRMVDARFAEPLGIGDYAAALATTAPTLTRAVRAVLQRSPGAVLAERRLLEAQRLLGYTRASVADVAAASGFADPAYFARVFRARTGVAPSRFRRAALGVQPTVRPRDQ